MIKFQLVEAWFEQLLFMRLKNNLTTGIRHFMNLVSLRVCVWVGPMIHPLAPLPVGLSVNQSESLAVNPWISSVCLTLCPHVSLFAHPHADTIPARHLLVYRLVYICLFFLSVRSLVRNFVCISFFVALSIGPSV